MHIYLKPKHLLTFLCLVFFYSSHAQQKTSRPNIIYIMADDLGYADLSCYGRKDYQTPNLDKLASQGIKFMNAYSAAPVCTPTRVAFMTGRYPARTPVGLCEPIVWKDTMGLTANYTSLPALMKKAGYQTYLVGKWHLGFGPNASPLKNGFDEFFGFKGGAIDYISHNNPWGKNDLYENDQTITKDGYMTDLLRDKTIEIVSRKHSKPFFISLMLNGPHWPWQAPGDKPYPTSDTAKDAREWTQGGSSQTFAAMMKSLDDAVGKIIQTLDEQNLSANTVVIFTSDNGGERYSDNSPYKESKMSLWEGGIREPAFVRWPGKIKENSLTNQVVTTMDWTATILSLAGGKADPKFPLDGMDVSQILTGKKKEVDRTLYWRIFQRKQHKAILDGKWKWLQDEKGNEYLFDLNVDPTENNNLKDQHQDILEKLRSKYHKWEAAMLRPIKLGA